MVAVCGSFRHGIPANGTKISRMTVGSPIEASPATAYGNNFLSRSPCFPSFDGAVALQVSLQDVALRFPETQTAVLGPLTTTIHQGEFVSLVGPSGCGKSTLLRLIAGLLTPTAGTISLNHPTSETDTKARIGFVFQHPTLLPWRSARNNMLLPLELGSFGRQHSGLKTDEDGLALLRQVGLAAADADKYPRELSGGMQMRLSLARALAVDPEVLLLDEPLAAVDDLLRLKLQEDVSNVHCRQHLTTILVTHNLHEAVFMSDRVLVLGDTPSRIVSELQISEPQPRTAAFRSAASFNERVNDLSATLFGAVLRQKD